MPKTPKRAATIERRTKETSIELTVDLDGTGEVRAATGIGFLDHMLDHFGKHSLTDLTVRAAGRYPPARAGCETANPGSGGVGRA